MHACDEPAGVEVRCTEKLERARRAAAFGERAAFEHDRAGVAACHRHIRCVRARVDPGALAERPAVTGRRVGIPAVHADHRAIDVKAERVDEPARQFTHRQAVSHRQWAGADEAFPTRPQPQPLDWSSRRVGAVEDPYRLAVQRGGLEQVAQCRDEGVDAAAEILQIDEQHVAAGQHGWRRSAHRAVEAEHRDAVYRIEEVRRLDHVVLLVAAQSVLGAEGGAQLQIGEGRQGVDGVRQVGGDRRRVRDQGDAAAAQRPAQVRVGEQAVKSGLQDGHWRFLQAKAGGGASSRAKPARW